MTEPLHRQEFPVHSYEVDTEGLLTPRALFAFLQEAAGGDAARAGYTMERLAEERLVHSGLRPRADVGHSRWKPAPLSSTIPRGGRRA